MATIAQFRAAALALPETEEKSHVGHPDFRVRGKIFAGINPDGKRGSLKLESSTFARLDPKAYQLAAGAWGRAGWTYVTLAAVTVAELKNVLAESHALVSASVRRRAK